MAKKPKRTVQKRLDSSDVAATSRAGINPAWLFAGIVYLLIAMRPISAPSTWWDLSRGRAVIGGHIAPSRALLVADSQSESDWLSGVPGYLAYRLANGGGLMLCRLAVLMAISLGVSFMVRGQLHRWQIVLANASVLIVSSRVADPGPLAWDQLGVLSCFLVGYCGNANRPLRNLTWLAATMLFWGNFGPRFAVAPMVWLSASLLRQSGEKNGEKPEPNAATGWAVPFLTVFLFGCFTPRGIYGWWDSARTLFPQLAAMGIDLSGSPWESLIDVRWTLIELTGILLWILVVILPVRTVSARLAMTVAPSIGGGLALASAANVGWASLWLCLLLTAGTARRLYHLPNIRVTQSDFFQRLKRSLKRPVVAIVATLVLVTLVVKSGATRPMGWGMDAQLDDRILRMNLESFDFRGLPWSDRESAIGMWCWVTSGRDPVYDSPRRALLGGRLAEMMRLGSDLRGMRQFWYLRSDGSAGGWWLALNERKISLLLVDASDTRLLRGLSSSIWQPLMLDSPVIVSARAGDSAYQEPLLRLLAQRELVEFGPWQYSGVTSTSSDFDRDRWGFLPPIDSASIALRQARVFRAIPLPVAALRVLNWVRRELPSDEALNETLEVHRELQRREFLAAGAVSPLRTALLDGVPVNDAIETSATSKTYKTLPGLQAAAVAYLEADFDAAERAIKALSTSEAQLVLGLLAWETGRPDAAIGLLQEMQRATADQGVKNLAAWWLQLLEPGDEKGLAPAQSADPHVPRGHE